MLARTKPFWPVSITGLVLLCEDISKEPPIELIELAVEVRRAWCRPLEPGRCNRSWFVGKGYPAVRCGELAEGSRLSRDCRWEGEDMLIQRLRGRRLLEAWG